MNFIDPNGMTGLRNVIQKSFRRHGSLQGFYHVAEPRWTSSQVIRRVVPSAQGLGQGRGDTFFQKMAVLEQNSTLNPDTRSKREETASRNGLYLLHSYCLEIWTVSGALPPSALVQTRTGISKNVVLPLSKYHFILSWRQRANITSQYRYSYLYINL
jgi:hypothetical protein